MPTSPAHSPIANSDLTAVATLFGPPSVQRGRTEEVQSQVLGAGKPLVLLARLIVDRKPITREATMAFLWPEMPEIRARASLRQALHLLRQALGPHTLESDRHTIRLSPGFPSDVDAFLRSVAAGDDEAVTRHYGGVFLENLSVMDSSDAEQWIEFERRRLSRLFQDAACRRTSFLAASGHIENAVTLAGKLRNTDPTSARLWRPLLTSLIAGGNIRELASERAALRAHVDADLIDDPELARVMLDPIAGEDDIAVPIEIVAPERHPSDARLMKQRDLIEYDEELAHLTSIWQRAAGGVTARCVIVAPDGAGKSTLLREFVTRIPPTGTRILAIDAERWMRDDPLSYVSQLIELLVELPAAIKVSRQSATTLAAIAPTVRQRLPSDRSTEEHQRHNAVADALREVLTEIAGEGAFVLLLDDLHAADSDSLKVLGMLLDNYESIPVLMLGAGHSRSDPALAGWPVCTLKPFECEQTARQLSQVTGARLSPDVVEPIHRVAAGRPLIAHHTVRLLLESGQLRITDGLMNWSGTPSVSINAHDVLTARVAQRSAGEHELLGILAVSGCALPVSTLSELSELLPTAEHVLSVVEVLVSANLLALDESHAVKLSHDEIAIAVLRTMLMEDRKTIARRVGLTLASRASTFHEMRRVVQLLILAEAPSDLASMLNRWGAEWPGNSAVASAVTATLRVGLRLAPPPEATLPRWRASSRVVATAAALIGALAVALVAWRR
jgi:DNA-binding SARP family transcriptional activator